MMAVNREVITGSDFKRMVAGAYSEFLLEYEKINRADPGYNSGKLPGTHILRTLGAAIMPLSTAKDESIGGLSRRVATAAIFGARGTTGIVLSQLFRGMAKGLAGKYNAASSEFGKAFQYGILFAQRVLPEHPDRPFIIAAKAVAKGAYHAVRANLPISEILTAAIQAGEKADQTRNNKNAGEMIMFTFLTGCLKGLDGNFVSPAVSLSLGLTAGQDNLPDPRRDLVRPYCVSFKIMNTGIDVSVLKKQLNEYGSFALVEREDNCLRVHMHTDEVGKVMENAVGWGKIEDIRVVNMAESHVLTAHSPLMQVAALGVAADDAEAERLQKGGASIIVRADEFNSPSVAELVSAAHSDLAAYYVMIAPRRDYWLAFRQAKRLLGDRIELVLCVDSTEQITALNAFAASATATDNAKIMSASIGR